MADREGVAYVQIITSWNKFLFTCLAPTHHEAIHNLINLHLFPRRILRLGQFEHFRFRDADITFERTGNLYSSSSDTLTYRYCIEGPNFNLCLLAMWSDPDEATADVHVVAISPNDGDALEALHEWLAIVVTAKMPPRDPFESMKLDY